jgi:uncharacterized protein
MLRKLMPRSDEFFDDFDKLAAATSEGARLFKDLVDDFRNVPAKVKALKDVEHRGDEITHRSFERLHKQFITPFDRAEIHRLLSRIDDVLDMTDAAAQRLALFDVKAILPEARQLADVLVSQTVKMEEAVNALRTVKEPARILQACREVNELENVADTLFRGALAKLFNGGRDPLEVMKWREILGLMEDATDRAEDVANVIEGVVLEHA